MSSASSIRRIKERGGAGGKIAATKPQKTPIQTSQKENSGSCKKSGVKENTRTLSGAKIPPACRRSAIQQLPMQRIDKAAAIAAPCPEKEGESRVRWSTSSIPKGKSSNPTDFARYLADLRTTRLSRVSGTDHSAKTRGKVSEAENSDKKGRIGVSDNVVLDRVKFGSGFRVIEKCRQKKDVLSSIWERRGEKSVNGSRVSENGNLKENLGNGSRDLDGCKYLHLKAGKSSDDFTVAESCKEISHLNSNLDAKSEKYLNVPSSTGDCTDEACLEGAGGKDINGAKVTQNDSINGKSDVPLTGVRYSEDCKGANGDRILGSSGDIVHTDRHLAVEDKKSLEGFRILENAKEQRDGEECKAVHAVCKYPSKLHEKLAFLEGKVNRIASDIKRTKEMLELNNPDASKLILSDIQDKIMGIEKTVGHVMDDNRSSLCLTETVKAEHLQLHHAEKIQDESSHILKNSLKGFNHEDVEARFFPHHKLLRNRTSSASFTGKDQNHESANHDSASNLVPIEKSPSPIDENPIALEFLASLEMKQSKININNSNVRLESSAIQEMGSNGCSASATQGISKKLVNGNYNQDVILTADENFEGFGDQENRPSMFVEEDMENPSIDQLQEIGCRSAAGGWFVSEGESVLLAHNDGSCSFYDITNSEGKAEYKPPSGVSHNLWGDCWFVRAPGADGCSGRYVVAASAGGTLDSGFCSWDFYTKDIRAFRIEGGTTHSSSLSRTVLGPLPNVGLHGRNTLSTILSPENQQWWYKPCGPLLVSTASSQRVATIYDIRDGDLVMRWELQKPVLSMEYSSPLQWRNKWKLVIAETEGIAIWDVNSINPQSLLSIPVFGRKVSALHVNNTDAELGGGVRQRVTSSEAEGNDGVFCTKEAISVMDFRLPSGVGVKISKTVANSQSIFCRGDSIFVGSSYARSAAQEHPRSCVQHFSLRKGRLVSTYLLPQSKAHAHHSSITQVWGNSNHVMGICGEGLFVFDTYKDEGLQIDHGITKEATDVIGPDDLYYPSFDYLASRVLLISRDRPALWRYLP